MFFIDCTAKSQVKITSGRITDAESYNSLVAVKVIKQGHIDGFISDEIMMYRKVNLTRKLSKLWFDGHLILKEHWQLDGDVVTHRILMSQVSGPLVTITVKYK